MQNDITLTILGGGQEIGANCYLLKWGKTNILLDCGLSPSRIGYDALPALDMLYQHEIHAIVLTHAQLDHIGSLTFVVNNYLALGGRIFMTVPTGHLIPLMSMESVKQLERNRIPRENQYYYHHYFDRKIVNGLSRYFSPQELNQPYELAPGITAQFFPAGHILGAAGISIQDGKYHLIYTGDISTEQTETISGCALPEGASPDCLIIESTHGGNEAPVTDGYDAAYKALAETVKAVLKRQGHVLIPCFALGRAQEIVRLFARMKTEALIPDDTPIFVHRGSTEQVNRIYDLAGARAFLPASENPETNRLSMLCSAVNAYRDDDHFKSAAELSDRPSVFLFTNGMMARNSPSALLAAELLQDDRHGIFFCGYVAPTQFGYQVLNSKPGQYVCTDLEASKWIRVVNPNIRQFSFSAHAHREQLIEIAKKINASLTVWVHGDAGSTQWLQQQFVSRYQKSSLAPLNREAILLRSGKNSLNRSYTSYRAVLVTVGTSLLTGYLRRNNLPPGGGAKVTSKALIDDIVGHLSEIHQLSAETSSLYRKPLQADDYLYFIAGDNPEARMCAKVLGRLYDGHHLHKEVIVKGLVSDATIFESEGMKNLMESLTEIIETHNGNTVIHATGGYKAQIALATMIGILFRQEVYYLYEDFANVVRLPEVPLNFDFDMLLGARQSFFELMDAHDYDRSDDIYSHLPEPLKHCFYHDPVLHRYSLTPLGRAMVKAFRRATGQFAKSIPISVMGPSSLWGNEKDAVGKILNPVIGIILERICHFHTLVRCFDFSSQLLSSEQPEGELLENCLEYVKSGPSSLTYRIRHMGAIDGLQEFLTIETEPGMAAYLVGIIGKRIYP